MKGSETSFSEALGRAHAALLKDLSNLEEAARASSGERSEELRDRLEATLPEIAEHFRFEEQNGYLDSVRKGEPRLERTVQQLALEHCQLMQSLNALLDRAKAGGSSDVKFKEEVRKWVQRVRLHEAHENDLVQDAFDFDVGAED
jgi:hemerythrin